MITTSHQGEWDSILPATHERIVCCSDCGAWRRASHHPHAPHFNSKGQRVDCVGREVRPATPPPFKEVLLSMAATAASNSSREVASP